MLWGISRRQSAVKIALACLHSWCGAIQGNEQLINFWEMKISRIKNTHHRTAQSGLWRREEQNSLRAILRTGRIPVLRGKGRRRRRKKKNVNLEEARIEAWDEQQKWPQATTEIIKALPPKSTNRWRFLPHQCHRDLCRRRKHGELRCRWWEGSTGSGCKRGAAKSSHKSYPAPASAISPPHLPWP